MTVLSNYGVVYTPEALAKFTAKLLLSETTSDVYESNSEVTVLDPACGEGILLKEFANEFNIQNETSVCSIGIDVEDTVVNNNKRKFQDKTYQFICKNTIIPSEKLTAFNYWRHQIKNLPFVIANPPWSSEKVFTNLKKIIL